jgi:hypothetical protein
MSPARAVKCFTIPADVRRTLATNALAVVFRQFWGAGNGSMRDFQELADEAFADLLHKHGRPVDLKTALRQSVGEIEKRPAAPSVRRRDASRKARRGE